MKSATKENAVRNKLQRTLFTSKTEIAFMKLQPHAQSLYKCIVILKDQLSCAEMRTNEQKSIACSATPKFSYYTFHANSLRCISVSYIHIAMADLCAVMTLNEVKVNKCVKFDKCHMDVSGRCIHCVWLSMDMTNWYVQAAHSSSWRPSKAEEYYRPGEQTPHMKIG